MNIARLIFHLQAGASFFPNYLRVTPKKAGQVRATRQIRAAFTSSMALSASLP